MKKKFNWCFIGAGSIAFITAREVCKSDYNNVYSVWNRTYEKAERFGKEFNTKVYKNVEDALNDPEVDGVYIALTNDLHFEYMKKCIKHHKPILCEKPFTKNLKEAKEIFDLAKLNKVYVSEAMWTWHNKSAYKVKELLKDIGNIKEVTCEFSFVGTHVKRLMDINLLGGALLDIGVYGLRYSLELFGMPKNIICVGKLLNGVDLHEEVIFKNDGFNVRHRFAVDEDYGINYKIIGDKGIINVPEFQATKKVELIKDGKTTTFINDVDLYETQFFNVAKEIKKGLLTSKIITKENTLLCMKLMDECRKQMGLIYPNE